MRLAFLASLLFALVSCKQGEGEYCQVNADCEIGQRGYVKKLNYYDPQQRNLESDAHTPGDQGPTFKGSPHVPAGETFSRERLELGTRTLRLADAQRREIQWKGQRPDEVLQR